jgi:hypothetical protein
MKLLNQVRVNLFWTTVKRWIWFILLIAFIVIIFLINQLSGFIVLYFPTLTNLLKDPVISTLIGAIIGGTMSFYGSIFVQQNQVKALSAIRRRDEIFIPLYNELLALKKFLSENPNFSQIKYSKQSTYPNDPLFLLWPSFKEDNRHLQIPKPLSYSLDQFMEICDSYTKQRSIAVDDKKVGDVIKKVILNNSIEDNSHRVDLVVHYLPCNNNLSQIKNSLKHDTGKYETVGNTTYLKQVKSEKEIEEIAQNIFKECSLIDSIKALQINRAHVDHSLEELINSLELIIRFINEKVEGNERWA